MQFKMFIENTSTDHIYIDLDDTLIVDFRYVDRMLAINGLYDNDYDESTIVKMFNGIILENGRFVFVRPNAQRFIKEMSNIAPTSILTYGHTMYQRNVVKSLGWNINVIGYDLFNFMPKTKSILIDNNPCGHPHIHDKLAAMGGDCNDLITVNAWNGDMEDNELMPLVNKIKFNLQ